MTGTDVFKQSGGLMLFPPPVDTNRNLIAWCLIDLLLQIGFNGQFMSAVAEGHEGALERVAIGGAAYFYQAFRSKKSYRFRPLHKCPSSLGATFLKHSLESG